MTLLLAMNITVNIGHTHYSVCCLCSLSLSYSMLRYKCQRNCERALDELAQCTDCGCRRGRCYLCICSKDTHLIETCYQVTCKLWEVDKHITVSCMNEIYKPYCAFEESHFTFIMYNIIFVIIITTTKAFSSNVQNNITSEQSI